MSFGIKSIEHFLAAGFADAKKVLSYVDTHDAKLTDPAFQATVEGITSVTLGAGAVEIERAAFAALGLVVAAVHQANLAAQANGLSVPLDAATVADFKGLITGFKPVLASLGYKL